MQQAQIIPGGKENMISPLNNAMANMSICHFVTYDPFKLQFEGSDVLEDKIERFSASLRNHLHWQYNEDEGPFLCSDLSLKISIEVRAQESQKHCGGT